MTFPNDPFLIIGGNGKTGARVNRLLLDKGYPTRLVSRSTSLSFDWEQSATWATALQGTRAAYVTFYPDLALPYAASTIAEFARLAKESGLHHVVLLSGRGEVGAQNAEEALKGSGLSWTIVRASWFHQNFSENFLLEGVLAGEVALPVGDVTEPFVDADDIAEVVATALTQPGHLNRLYEVTGPRSLTFSEVVEEISRAVGRPIKLTKVSMEAYMTRLKQSEVPEGFQWLLHELFTQILDGRNSSVMPGIQQALGRPGRDFATYATQTAATGVWSKPFDVAVP